MLGRCCGICVRHCGEQDGGPLASDVVGFVRLVVPRVAEHGRAGANQRGGAVRWDVSPPLLRSANALWRAGPWCALAARIAATVRRADQPEHARRVLPGGVGWQGFVDVVTHGDDQVSVVGDVVEVMFGRHTAARSRDPRCQPVPGLAPTSLLCKPICMTTNSVPADGDPRRLLAASRHLAHRVRVSQRVTWFPLLVLAAVTFAAIPVARFGPIVLDCAPVPNQMGAQACAVYRPVALFVYWPVALLLAYAAIAYCYERVARARGLGGRVAPYVIAGVVLTGLFTAVAVWGAHEAELMVHHQPATLYGPHWIYRLLGADGAIGLALLVLALLERHLALLLFTVAYLAVVLVPINFGWGSGWGPTWGYAPSLVINGGVLLLGGLGFALAQRRGRTR